MVLAGDVGGTKVLVGLYEKDGASTRPRKLASREFLITDHADLPAILRAFITTTPAAASLDAASFGVAGPVLGRSATLTNVPWRVDADEIAKVFQIPRVGLLNDLEAMAYGVTVLADSEVRVLQEGHAAAPGNMAVIAAGTGLGEALLHNIGGRFVPSPSEAGHADFPARNERELELLRDLTVRFGRGEVEHVVSGRGLVNIHRVTHARACEAVTDLADPNAPAMISDAALAGRCAGCVEALNMFVEAYGAEAGNLALRSVATAGVFVGGGIAPKILPVLEDGRFMKAFQSKGSFEQLLRKIPVKVVLNPEVGLLGAAVHASQS